MLNPWMRGPRYAPPNRLEDPELKVPKIMHSRDLPVFQKECKLTGWNVRKGGRRWMFVEGEGETAVYRRTRKVWVHQGTYPFVIAPLKSPTSRIFYLPRLF